MKNSSTMKKGNSTYRRWTGLVVLAILSFQFSTAQELLNYPLDTIDGEEVYRYEVERSIGLYRIGVNFGVSQSEIIRLNPQLRERGLHYGETLLIPTKRPVVKETEAKVVQTIITETRIGGEEIGQPQVVPQPTDTVITGLRDTVITEEDSVLPKTRKVVELALMLPFESQQTKRSVNADRMMEFYEGALIALSEKQNDSTLYRLRVYDTERSERKVHALCDSTELDSVQAIIGPVYPIQIERVATWCDKHEVPLILPFSDNIELEAHPYALQFNSTPEQEADSLCQWIKAKGEAVHCVAIEVRESDLSSTIRTLRNTMSAQGIEYERVTMRDLVNDSAEYAFDKEKENLVILHSTRFQHIRVLLTHLYKLQTAGYRIRLVSRYGWQKETIDLPQVYTSVFTRSEGWEPYDAMWSEYFQNDHSSDAPRYDLLGYDLISSALAWLRGEKEHAGLQSEIRWTKIQDGGYQNASVRVVER